MIQEPGQEPVTELSSERAADFAALDRAAREQEQTAAADGGEVDAAPVIDLGKEIAGALLVVSKMIGPMFPSVAAIYSEEMCLAVGGSMVPVCEKYGWLQGGIGGKYGPEIACLAVVGPLAWMTVEAAKADIAARRPAKPENLGLDFEAAPVQGAAAAPGQKTVTFGAPVAA